MKVSGDALLHAPVNEVWDALLDPQVLVRTIPGCERLESTGENDYAMTVTAGVASIKGTYAGKCSLSDLRPNESLLLRADGAGSPGTIGVDVKVSFTDNGDGTTRLDYDADAVVGGAIGGVGQRMLTSVSKRMAAGFFDSVNDALTGAEAPTGAPAQPEAASAASASAASAAGQTFTAPPRGSGQDDFLKGIAVGAGLVLVGVAASVLADRFRR